MKNQFENTEADFSDFKSHEEPLFAYVYHMLTMLNKRNKKNFRSALSKAFSEKCDALEAKDPSIKDITMYFIEAVAEERLYFDSKRNWYHMLTDPTNEAKIGYLLGVLINENFVSAEVSKIGTEIHKRVSAMMLDLIGMKNTGSSVALSTPGGSEANLLALKLALYDTTRKVLGYDLRNKGLCGMSKIPKILVPDTAHYSFEQTAQTLGIGIDNLVKIPTKDFSVSADDMKIALAEIKENEIVVGIVSVFGATETGAYDDLPEIAKVIEEYKKNHEVWWHIDAAYGGPFLGLSQFAKYQKAINYADSVTIDAHKHLWTPFGAGFICVKDMVAFRGITTDAPYIGNTTNYMTDEEYCQSLFDHIGGITITGSRLSSGVMSTYLTLLSLGKEKIYADLQKTLYITTLLEQKMKVAGIEVTSGQKLNLLTFRPKADSLAEANVLVDKIQKHLSEHTENGVLVSKTDLNKGKSGEPMYVNRICIMSPLANESDVDEFVVTYKQTINHVIEVVTK